MTDIKYIAFYDLPSAMPQRVFSPAAASKIDYISSALNKSDFSVSIVSPAWADTATEFKHFQLSSKKTIDDHLNLVLAPTFSGGHKILIYLKIILALTWLFFYLIRNARKDEKILVYHSIWITIPILLAQKFKKFKIVLEVEEIYQDVKTLHPLFDKWEDKMLTQAHSYLFSTDLLPLKLKTTKPFVVIYGSYSVHPKIATPPTDGKIHLLYAGIIDFDKRGAVNALESAMYLPENYVLHIIGFGELDTFLPLMREHNKTARCQASYHGNLSGDEYIKFCQSCHIGLSTQTMEGDYLQSSFPSKLLSYLGMGLRAVSSTVECVKLSEVDNLIYYYLDDHPKAIAEAVTGICVNGNYDSVEVIKKLDIEFIKDLKELLVK